MVAAGEFREDLYYRINVVQLRIPPLRERREDILPLAARLLAEIRRGTAAAATRADAGGRAALKNYPWPGNIRELKNALERASLLSDGRIISHDNLFDRPAPALTAMQTSQQPARLPERVRARLHRPRPCRRQWPIRPRRLTGHQPQEPVAEDAQAGDRQGE